MSKVFLASRNAGKLAEMQRILAAHLPDILVLGLDDVTPYDEPAETEPTFEGNAVLKARAAVTATGLPSLADDSGLCVDALNGMPGVLSARWAGVGDAPRQVKDDGSLQNPAFVQAYSALLWVALMVLGTPEAAPGVDALHAAATARIPAPAAPVPAPADAP